VNNERVLVDDMRSMIEGQPHAEEMIPEEEEPGEGTPPGESPAEPEEEMMPEEQVSPGAPPAPEEEMMPEEQVSPGTPPQVGAPEEELWPAEEAVPTQVAPAPVQAPAKAPTKQDREAAAIQKLIALADKLDDAGRTEEADAVDGVIQYSLKRFREVK